MTSQRHRDGDGANMTETIFTFNNWNSRLERAKELLQMSLNVIHLSRDLQRNFLAFRTRFDSVFCLPVAVNSCTEMYLSVCLLTGEVGKLNPVRSELLVQGKSAYRGQFTSFIFEKLGSHFQPKTFARGLFIPPLAKH